MRHRARGLREPERVFSAREIFPMDPVLVDNIIQKVNELSGDGFRVLPVAIKKLER
jgi:hypothetical protein